MISEFFLHPLNFHTQDECLARLTLIRALNRHVEIHPTKAGLSPQIINNSFSHSPIFPTQHCHLNSDCCIIIWMHHPSSYISLKGWAIIPNLITKYCLKDSWPYGRIILPRQIRFRPVVLCPGRTLKSVGALFKNSSTRVLLPEILI